jgi:hypothetical protein
MDMELKEKFLKLWNKYFGESELPFVFYYTQREGCAKVVPPPSGHVCIIGVLSKVRKGNTLCFEADSIGCSGGIRYLGFAEDIMPDFEYFLSYGIPEKFEGERYKKSPEIVKEIVKRLPRFKAPHRFIVFKRWDMLEKDDEPDVAIFLAKPDVLSGLFTLANFDEADPNIVYSPFAAGCGTIVQYPYLENDSDHPKCILGMFDVSARPCVPRETLSFAAPMKKFILMINNMEESFLIGSSWLTVKKRIGFK